MNDDEIPKHRSKKDKKKWCKGKVGTHHKGVPMLKQPMAFGPNEEASSVELVCTKCGKTVEWWWPFYKWTDAPDWVPMEMRAKIRARFQKHNGF